MIRCLMIAIMYLGWISAAAGAANSDKKIVAILMLDENSVPSQELNGFFIQAAARANQTEKWEVAPFTEYLYEFEGSRELPTLRMSKEAIDGLAGKGLIPKIQRILETKAYHGGMLVHCSQVIRGLFESCALYFYQRQGHKVIASVQKKFVVPIEDPSAWSTFLVDKLHDGIAAQLMKREQSYINGLLNQATSTADEADNSAKQWLLISLGNDVQRSRSLGHIALVNGAVGFLHYRGKSGLGLELGGGRSIDNKKQANSYYGGVLFSSYFQFADNARWGLDAFLGYQRRSVTARGAGGEIKTAGLLARIEPSLAWSAYAKYLVGMGLRYQYFLDAAIEQSGSLKNDRLSRGSYGLSIFIRREL